MPNIRELLEHDHREVKQMFTEFATSGEKTLAEKICSELMMHAELEEKIVYPVLRGEVSQEKAEEGEREHSKIEELITRIRSMTMADGLRGAMSELQRNVEHHVQEEETQSLPQMQRMLGEQRMSEMGQRFMTAKQLAKSGADGNAASADGHGTGTIDLRETTKQELYEMAKEAGIEGRSKMTKKELAEAVAHSS